MIKSKFIELPAVSGIQAGRPYYCIMCPLKLVPQLFTYTDNSLPPDMREQRTLNKQRIPEMRDYVLQNRDSYIFSALTASVDGEMEFVPYKNAKGVGKLRIAADAQIIINDGQHRRAAIEAALNTCPEIAFEDISIVIYYDLGLKRSQQMFSDLNRHAVRPTKSLDILYDNRDTFSLLIKDCIREIPVFNGSVECEKSAISNRSAALFTLSGIYHATKIIFSGLPNMRPEDARRTVIDFWTAVGDNMTVWKIVKAKEITPERFRKEYVCAHTITLKAIGTVGKILVTTVPNHSEWSDRLAFLREINWNKENPELQGLVIAKGRISSSYNNQKAFGEYLVEKSDFKNEVR